MSDTPQIYGRMVNVMRHVSAVRKSDHNDFQNFNFRGIDAVMNAVGPALREYEVVVVPRLVDVTYEDVKTSNNKPSTACRVQMEYRFYAPDGSHVETSVAGEAWDTGDKACPKAMSVAFRTALLQALCLPTDEPDPDSVTYERGDAPPPLDDFLDQWPKTFLATQDLGKMRKFASVSKAQLEQTLRVLDGRHADWEAAS